RREEEGGGGVERKRERGGVRGQMANELGPGFRDRDCSKNDLLYVRCMRTWAKLVPWIGQSMRGGKKRRGGGEGPPFSTDSALGRGVNGGRIMHVAGDKQTGFYPNPAEEAGWEGKASSNKNNQVRDSVTLDKDQRLEIESGYGKEECGIRVKSYTLAVGPH
ncbi:hypothetical protein BJ684DRAFT_16709, partial [Piptocephalis cylindrospora]